MSIRKTHSQKVDAVALWKMISICASVTEIILCIFTVKYIPLVSFIGLLVMFAVYYKYKLVMEELKDTSDDAAISYLEKALEDANFKDEQYIEKDIIEASEIFEFDNVRGFNKIEGTFKDTGLACSRVVLTKNETVSDKSVDFNVFKGLWLCFNETFCDKCDLVIFPKAELGNKVKLKPEESVISTGHELFDKLFIVKTTTPRLAEHVINKEATELMLSFNDSALVVCKDSTAKLYMSIKNGTVNIAIDTAGEDLFEREFKTETSAAILENNYREEMQKVISIIESILSTERI